LIREFATIGIIEGFQSAMASSRGINPEVQVKPWLRPESLRWSEHLTGSGTVTLEGSGRRIQVRYPQS
jgi:hypothetical protein